MYSFYWATLYNAFWRAEELVKLLVKLIGYDGDNHRICANPMRQVMDLKLVSMR